MCPRAIENNPFWKNSKRNFVGQPINTIESIRGYVSGETVFIIGAGPSLNNNLEVFANRWGVSKGVIFCTDGAIHDLRRVNVKPDFVVSCEADGEHTVDKEQVKYPTTEDLLDVIDRDFYRTVPLIASSWCNSLFIDGWPCRQMFWYVNHFKSKQCNFQNYFKEYPEMFPHLGDDKSWPLIQSKNVMCGFQAIEIARYLDAKEVVLLGFDVQGTQDNHHSKGFNMNWSRSSVDLKTHYEKQLKEFVEEFGGDFGIKTFNCSEGGAITEQNSTARVMMLRDYFRGYK